MAEYSIGLDLGGTNLRAAAIDRSGKMLDKISGATDFVHGREAVLGDIVAAIERLREKHGAAGSRGHRRRRAGFHSHQRRLPHEQS